MALVAATLAVHAALADTEPATAEPQAQDGQQNMLQLLDQLDQLDKTDRSDFDAAIERVYQCSDKEDFKCADQQLKRAGALVYDDAAKQSLAQASKYRSERYQFMKDEKERVAMQERMSECSDSCPISREYKQCVNGNRSPHSCDEPQQQYQGPSTLDMLNSALIGMKQNMEQSFAQQQAQLKQQQQMLAEQRRQREQAQEERRRQIERQRQQQTAAAEQQEAELKRMREQQELARRRAEEKQKRELAARQVREAREREQQARELARQQQEAEKEQRKANYLAQLKQGARLRGMSCYGGKYVAGALPKIRPTEVECVDVHFTVQCPNSSTIVHRGVLHNIVSNGEASCYGDSAEVPKTLACDAEDFVVRAAEVTGCQL
ncbi:DUF1682 domain-containing protein [Solimonas marina]|uniref:DUF1682 domain-containing protein n=1 Tax=Solimonas marina TaxID=2714601 RepID=A0A969WC88_9GAMM|nr:DUF1682 domain-containing protein [Solimonas marina]NKF24542.1 DUF1682 domain-containing protein [Solimonas marina]